MDLKLLSGIARATDSGETPAHTISSDLDVRHERVEITQQVDPFSTCMSRARGVMFNGQFDRSIRSAAFEQRQQHHNAQDAYAGDSPDDSVASEDSLAAAEECSSIPPNSGGKSIIITRV